MSKDGRVFLRGITSEHYGLSGLRQAQMAAPRVRGPEHQDIVDGTRAGFSEGSKANWRLSPRDEPFLTQTLEVHFVDVHPDTIDAAHAHQNEAAFYILEGSGYEIHDGQRYEWEADDLVVVHTDSVHGHASHGDPALTLVFKAKATWMLFGLIQQGRPAPVPDEGRLGTRQEWSQLWTPGVGDRKKVVKPADTRWETTRDGHVRVILSPDRTDVRCFSVDLYQQRIPAGSHSAKHWHMADEVLYVQSGSGVSLHWEVEAEIAERYYARVAREPTSHEFTAGDIIYVPQNTVHRHVAGAGEDVLLLSAQNRLFRFLGYDAVAHLEDAPEYQGQRAGGGMRR
ncbi:MAG: cupin domain-containing protein [Nitriliruptorales bacterium]|nr:cupin domain-containing protein [Nitriliruptorales bacterium]